MSVQFLFWLLIGIWPIDVSAQTTVPTPPRMAGYLGILHPLVTIDGNGSETNFSDYYVVGFPIGLNLWKTDRVGFSAEIVPIIRAENHVSRVSNVLFHPGILLGLGNGFTFAGRLAFETNGRYGVTPVFNKVVKRNKDSSYFVAIPIPVRFGNDRSASAAVGFQFGIAF
ncbi:hypothetical protein G8759_30820 [Spirosoma aureum]|uniref:Outer membrane beta-barrel protein n=1 Tax=Spirosoma aureum TaxID=2692134 RepID=A0A6G9B073_9BACT|nr:hypothetical protein G8759_30820 [Spirosoma aureum]